MQSQQFIAARALPGNNRPERDIRLFPETEQQPEGDNVKRARPIDADQWRSQWMQMLKSEMTMEKLMVQDEQYLLDLFGILSQDPAIDPFSHHQSLSRFLANHDIVMLAINPTDADILAIYTADVEILAQTIAWALCTFVHSILKLTLRTAHAAVELGNTVEVSATIEHKKWHKFLSSLARYGIGVSNPTVAFLDSIVAADQTPGEDKHRWDNVKLAMETVASREDSDLFKELHADLLKQTNNLMDSITTVQEDDAEVPNANSLNRCLHVQLFSPHDIPDESGTNEFAAVQQAAILTSVLQKLRDSHIKTIINRQLNGNKISPLVDALLPFMVPEVANKLDIERLSAELRDALPTYAAWPFTLHAFFSLHFVPPDMLRQTMEIFAFAHGSRYSGRVLEMAQLVHLCFSPLQSDETLAVPTESALSDALAAVMRRRQHTTNALQPYSYSLLRSIEADLPQTQNPTFSELAKHQSTPDVNAERVKSFTYGTNSILHIINETRAEQIWIFEALISDKNEDYVHALSLWLKKIEELGVDGHFRDYLFNAHLEELQVLDCLADESVERRDLIRLGIWPLDFTLDYNDDDHSNNDGDSPRASNARLISASNGKPDWVMLVFNKMRTRLGNFITEAARHTGIEFKSIDKWAIANTNISTALSGLIGANAMIKEFEHSLINLEAVLDKTVLNYKTAVDACNLATAKPASLDDYMAHMYVLTTALQMAASYYVHMCIDEDDTASLIKFPDATKRTPSALLHFQVLIYLDKTNLTARDPGYHMAGALRVLRKARQMRSEFYRRWANLHPYKRFKHLFLFPEGTALMQSINSLLFGAAEAIYAIGGNTTTKNLQANGQPVKYYTLNTSADSVAGYIGYRNAKALTKDSVLLAWLNNDPDSVAAMGSCGALDFNNAIANSLGITAGENAGMSRLAEVMNSYRALTAIAKSGDTTNNGHYTTKTLLAQLGITPNAGIPGPTAIKEISKQLSFIMKKITGIYPNWVNAARTIQETADAVIRGQIPEGQQALNDAFQAAHDIGSSFGYQQETAAWVMRTQSMVDSLNDPSSVIQTVRNAATSFASRGSAFHTNPKLIATNAAATIASTIVKTTKYPGMPTNLISTLINTWPLLSSVLPNSKSPADLVTGDLLEGPDRAKANQIFDLLMPNSSATFTLNWAREVAATYFQRYTIPWAINHSVGWVVNSGAGQFLIPTGLNGPVGMVFEMVWTLVLLLLFTVVLSRYVNPLILKFLNRIEKVDTDYSQ